MNLAVLGTGTVGQTIATKLVALGHNVKMGSRTAGNEHATAWSLSMASSAGQASHGTFADAALHGEIIFNCVNGEAALEALAGAGSAYLSGKVLIDLTNPLDFSRGFPPALSVTGHDSLAERIQAAYPDARVVKTLNTVSAPIMVDPACVPGAHDMFVAGNDPAARAQVTGILKDWFGWTSVLDLGDITAARGMESYVMLWVRLWGVTQTPDFNIRVAH